MHIYPRSSYAPHGESSLAERRGIKCHVRGELFWVCIWQVSNARLGTVLSYARKLRSIYHVENQPIEVDRNTSSDCAPKRNEDRKIDTSTKSDKNVG